MPPRKEAAVALPHRVKRARRNGRWGRSRDAGHELLLNFSDDVTRLTRL